MEGFVPNRELKLNFASSTIVFLFITPTMKFSIPSRRIRQAIHGALDTAPQRPKLLDSRV